MSKETQDKETIPLNKLILWGSLLIAVFVSIIPLLGEVGSANPKTADTLGLWFNFLGGFHPLFLHLPIGAFVLVLFLEFFALITKKTNNMTLALAFAAASSVFATLFGYFLYLTGDYTGELMDEHKRDGIIFTVLLILTFLIRYSLQYKKEIWIKFSYPTLLILSAGMMMSAGHHGGEMTHGDLFKDLPSKVQASREAQSVDPVIYAEIIQPIIEEKCVSCHGPDKDKGGLRMDSIEHMISGGDTEDCLVKSDLEASYMITSMELPLDDEYRMPPKDKPQITADELKVLKWWIEVGAPETEKLSEVEASKEILQSIKASMGK